MEIIVILLGCFMIFYFVNNIIKMFQPQLKYFIFVILFLIALMAYKEAFKKQRPDPENFKVEKRKYIDV